MTIVIVAANLIVFAAMAFGYHRLVEFNTHILVGWGAAYAPRTFGGQWWRLVTVMFLHDGHLSEPLMDTWSLRCTVRGSMTW